MANTTPWQVTVYFSLQLKVHFQDWLEYTMDTCTLWSCMYYTQLMLWVTNKCLYLVGKCELIECHRHTFHAIYKVYWVNFVCCRLRVFFKTDLYFLLNLLYDHYFFSQKCRNQFVFFFRRQNSLFRGILLSCFVRPCMMAYFLWNCDNTAWNKHL